MSLHGVGSPERSSAAAEVLRSFLDELPAAFFGSNRATGNPDPQQRDGLISRSTAAILEDRLRGLCALRVEEVASTRLNGAALPPCLTYSAVDGLVRLVGKLVPLVDIGPNGRSTGSSSRGDRCVSSAGGNEQDGEEGEEAASLVAANALVDLALLCLANLLESPSWRHVFFRVLHEVQLEQQLQHDHSPIAENGERPPTAVAGRSQQQQQQQPRTPTLQEFLWRKMVTEAPAGAGATTTATGTAARGRAGSSPSTPSSSSRLVVPVHRAAVRLCCNMVRHCPLSFPASSYASLAPHLADYLIGNAGASAAVGGDGGGAGGVPDEGSEADLMVLLDLFAACARGSPHFRQYVKGLRRKRELFRRLLACLSPGRNGGIVVRALCALTRVLAGDALEGKVRDGSKRLLGWW